MDENALLRLVIRCSAGARLGNPRDLKSTRLIVSGLPEIDFMSRLAKRQLTERAQVGAFEKAAAIPAGNSCDLCRGQLGFCGR